MHLFDEAILHDGTQCLRPLVILDRGGTFKHITKLSRIREISILLICLIL